MTKPAFLGNITRAFHKVGFEIKKHSPEILVAAGVTGVVASTVMACKATTKVNDIITETKEQLEPIHVAGEKLKEGEELVCSDGTLYTEQNYKQDLAIVYTQTAMKFVKLYAPAVILGALSLTAVLTSHRIMRKRNIALAAAYATVDKGFKDYRKRIVERFGEELDKEVRHNVKVQEVEEVVVNEKGEEETVKTTVKVFDPNQYSDFSRIFDETCREWTKDPEYNLMFLKMQQAHANDTLKARGYLFLNEVYEMIGFDKSAAGQVVGWVYDERNPVGDNFVDFGIYNLDNPRCAEFVNGLERSIILDFNVDGNILQTAAF